MTEINLGLVLVLVHQIYCVWAWIAFNPLSHTWNFIWFTICSFFLVDVTSLPVANADHSEHDCLLISILSHGELGYIYAKDTHYKLENIWSFFTAPRCPTLAGKPKLFFIQACQGDRLDGGITLSRTETDSSDSQSMAYKIPIHADFLIAYSTIPGA